MKDVNILILSKYPPIEGGVSSRVYWLAKALGERGHNVHIVTNALEVEPEYREVLDLNDHNYNPKNVQVHSTDPSPTIEANPSQIPFSKKYCEKLASLAIEVIEEHKIDLIDSRYLIPYAVSGYLAKSITGIPQIISHAGSDLQRLYPSKYLNRLLENILKSADGIITSEAQIGFFHNLGVPNTKIFSTPDLSVDTKVFNPDVSPFDLKPYVSDQRFFSGIPIIAYVGKITYNFESKGLPELLKACSLIKEDFLLLFVSNGKKIEQLKELVDKAKLTQKTVFIPFFPPWKMPSILKACTCLIALENGTSPTLNYHVPTTPAEAIAIGSCVLMSREIHEKAVYNKLKNGKEVLVVNNANVNELKTSLEKIIKNPEIANKIGLAGHNALLQKKDLNEYPERILEIYKSVLSQ